MPFKKTLKLFKVSAETCGPIVEVEDYYQHWPITSELTIPAACRTACLLKSANLQWRHHFAALSLVLELALSNKEAISSIIVLKNDLKCHYEFIS